MSTISADELGFLIDEVARLRIELADAHDLLRDAIPHLVGNSAWDTVARIRAHLALYYDEQPEVSPPS